MTSFQKISMILAALLASAACSPKAAESGNGNSYPGTLAAVGDQPNGTTPPPQPARFVLGIPLQEITSLSYEQRGGYPPPVPTSTKLWIGFQQNKNVAVAIVDVKVGDDENRCMRLIEENELREMQMKMSNLALGRDTSDTYGIDGGDAYLEIQSAGRDDMEYRFIGGDQSHVGEVIVTRELQYKLTSILTSLDCKAKPN